MKVMILPWFSTCVGRSIHSALRSTALLWAALSLLLLAGCGGLGGGTAQQGQEQSHTLQAAINHIIFYSQENRSFDTYLGHLNDYRVANGLPADADGMPVNASNPEDPAGPAAGGTVLNFHLITMCIENTSAEWGASHIQYNYWKPSSDVFVGDGFVAEAAASARYSGENDILGHRIMGYYTADDLPYHYWLASTFATSDRWFTPAPVETGCQRLYMMAATSHGFAHVPSSSSQLAGVKTIFDSLQAAGISWKVYYSDTDPTTGRPVTTLNYFQPFAANHQANIVPISQYFTDVQNGTLPGFAYLEPSFTNGTDEHPGIGNSVQIGVAYSAKLINALMSSPSWKDSVFIGTFDEHGGLYDHVAPPINVPSPDGIAPQDLFPGEATGDFTRYGFRVPLFVVSPFAKAHYISHTPMDFTSMLKLVETRFNLPNLTQRDSVANNMTEFFDFKNPPYMNPPAPPVQPTNGPCYDGLP